MKNRIVRVLLKRLRRVRNDNDDHHHHNRHHHHHNRHHDWIISNLYKKSHLASFSIITPQINGVLPLLLSCNTCLTQLRRLSFQSNWRRLCHTTRLGSGNTFHFFHQHTVCFIPVQLNLQVIVFLPRWSRPCRRRGPFYTLVHYYCQYLLLYIEKASCSKSKMLVDAVWTLWQTTILKTPLKTALVEKKQGTRNKIPAF